jgi:hypothetical protein
MAINEYKVHTIDEMIKILQAFKTQEGLPGSTPIYLSDFEFNGKQTQFEVTQVEGEKELFIMYEMNEQEWEGDEW